MKCFARYLWSMKDVCHTVHVCCGDELYYILRYFTSSFLKVILISAWFHRHIDALQLTDATQGKSFTASCSFLYTCLPHVGFHKDVETAQSSSIPEPQPERNTKEPGRVHQGRLPGIPTY
ncbi:hypothetical protein Bbelb_294460 [Branchiostoma belcheri]|nr:hypothetical protein Bbelb_294460 [Branchiostoma belcheri]